ncbi:hypothetical protein ACZ91_18770 [Streptomyces regensis]|nr:hypothetical protein ACZ91_18770 [Streptomyces regensis]
MSAKQGKLLRAEPIARQMIEDRVRLRGAFVPDLENEWATWQPSDQDSPGRIDASCVFAHGLIPRGQQGRDRPRPATDVADPRHVRRPGRRSVRRQRMARVSQARSSRCRSSASATRSSDWL